MFSLVLLLRGTRIAEDLEFPAREPRLNLVASGVSMKVGMDRKRLRVRENVLVARNELRNVLNCERCQRQ